MTVATTFSLFAAMTILALIPGPGVVAVVARASLSGFKHAMVLTLGMIFADFILITLALFGLTALISKFSFLGYLIQYLGGAYLIALGLFMFKTRAAPTAARAKATAPSHLASFSIGFSVTLSNPKAILFYLSFLPAFVDITQVGWQDALIIYLTIFFAVSGVMFIYSYMSSRTAALNRSPTRAKYLRYTGGLLLIASGCYMLAQR